MGNRCSLLPLFLHHQMRFLPHASLVRDAEALRTQEREGERCLPPLNLCKPPKLLKTGSGTAALVPKNPGVQMRKARKRPIVQGPVKKLLIAETTVEEVGLGGAFRYIGATCCHTLRRWYRCGQRVRYARPGSGSPDHRRRRLWRAWCHYFPVCTCRQRQPQGMVRTRYRVGSWTGSSQRHTIKSGCNPSDSNVLTVCCVGFVFCTPLSAVSHVKVEEGGPKGLGHMVSAVKENNYSVGGSLRAKRNELPPITVACGLGFWRLFRSTDTGEQSFVLNSTPREHATGVRVRRSSGSKTTCGHPLSADQIRNLSLNQWKTVGCASTCKVAMWRLVHEKQQIRNGRTGLQDAEGSTVVGHRHESHSKPKLLSGIRVGTLVAISKSTCNANCLQIRSYPISPLCY